MIAKGYRFGVYGADSKGTVLETGNTVSYHFDHDLEKVWTVPTRDFVKNTFPKN